MFERILEKLLFNSRWLLAPFYVMLVAALLGLLIKAGQETLHFVAHALTATESDVILGVLALVDLTLTGSLIVIVIFSGYENFVSKIDTGDDEDRPGWMGTVDFSGLKMKLIASIVAISAIALLKAFMKLAEGHAVSDVLGVFFRVVRDMRPEGPGALPEHVQLAFIRAIGVAQMRALEGVATPLQLSAMLVSLCLLSSNGALLPTLPV